MDNDNNTLVQMLEKSLDFMKDNLSKRIDDIKNEILEELMSKALPDYISFPVPKMLMAQVVQGKSTDKNQKPIETTHDNVFNIKFGKVGYNFLPLFKTTIINVLDFSVSPSSVSNTWELNFKTISKVDDLSGMAFLFHNLGFPIDSIEFFTANGQSLPIVMMSDYNQLPYIDIIRDYIQYSEDEQGYRMLHHWHDTLCTNQSSYCIIAPYDKSVIPIMSDNDGFLITMVVHSKNKISNLDTEKLMINCFPIINIETNTFSCTVNQYSKNENSIHEDENPSYNVRKLPNLTGRHFISLTKVTMNTGKNNSIDASKDVYVRRYGTERGNKSDDNNNVFLKLKRPQTDTRRYYIDYITTNTSIPIDTTIGEITASSSQFYNKDINNNTKINIRIVDDFIKTPPSTTDSNHSMGRYYLQTHDCLVSSSDILCFCMAKLISDFNYTREEIKSIRFVKEKFIVEIQIESIKEKPDSDISHCESALENMIKSRTPLSKPVKINIKHSYSNK